MNIILRALVAVVAVTMLASPVLAKPKSNVVKTYDSTANGIIQNIRG
jgi:hypothetical protein